MSDVRESSFVDLYSRGLVTADEIEYFVSEWHRRAPGSALHEYLGLSWDEYRRWAADPDALERIVADRGA